MSPLKGTFLPGTLQHLNRKCPTSLPRTDLVYEAQLHELVRERGGGVAAGHGARQLAVHLVVHAQQDRHLEHIGTTI